MRGCLLSDNIRAMRSVFARLALATAALAACNTPSPEGAKKDAPADTKVTAPADAKSPAPPVDAKTPAPTPDATKTADTAPANPADSAGAPPADSAGGDAKAADSAGGDAKAADPAAAGAGDKAKLLDEAKAKKTSDARAKKALEEAEKAGATVREVAEAANARGEALFDDGERAAAFFTWARDKDTTYPDPVWNLAKQTVNSGEIPATVELLKEVHKRGGKKLLKQIGFDPSFEIVKDDPEVQKLLK